MKRIKNRKIMKIKKSLLLITYYPGFNDMGDYESWMWSIKYEETTNDTYSCLQK